MRYLCGVWIILILAVAPYPETTAIAAMTLHTIPVSQDPTAVFFDAETHQVLVWGAPQYDKLETPFGPAHYTILAGATGKRTGLIIPTNEDYSLVRAADGSDRFYLPTAQGLQPLASNGRLGPAIGAVNLVIESTAYPSLGVDPQRNLQISLGGGAIEGFTLRTATHLYTNPLNTFLMVLDRSDARVFTSTETGLVVLAERTGQMQAELSLGYIFQLVLVPSDHLLVAYHEDPTNSELQVSIIDTRTLAVLHTITFGAVALGTWPPAKDCNEYECVPQEMAVDATNGVIAVLQTPDLTHVLLDVIDLHTGVVRRTMKAPTGAYTMALDSPLQRAYVTSNMSNDPGGRVTVFNLRTGATVAAILNLKGHPIGIAVDTPDNTVFVAGQGSDQKDNTLIANGVVTMFDARITGTHALSN